MPKAAPIAKVQATEGYGAKIVLYGDCYDDAFNKAMEICASEHATFLHPFDDYEVMAGQGTVGLEILRELPTVDTVVVPVGGGGLLAGVAACIKQVNPRVRVIGVQAEGANAVYRSFHEGKRVTSESVSTIADGIAVKSWHVRHDYAPHRAPRACAGGARRPPRSGATHQASPAQAPELRAAGHSGPQRRT
jgi:threonine dehydratase